MTKQQALEAILRKVRGWEMPGAEVKLLHEDVVAEQFVEAARDFETLVRVPAGKQQSETVRDRLVTAAAAALYLLVDEVTVVEGRTLEEWLASNEDERLARWAAGETRVVVEVVQPTSPALPPQGDEHEEAVG